MALLALLVLLVLRVLLAQLVRMAPLVLQAPLVLLEKKAKRAIWARQDRQALKVIKVTKETLA